MPGIETARGSERWPAIEFRSDGLRDTDPTELAHPDDFITHSNRQQVRDSTRDSLGPGILDSWRRGQLEVGTLPDVLRTIDSDQ